MLPENASSSAGTGVTDGDGGAAPQQRELRRQYSWALQGASPRQQDGSLLGWGRNDYAQLGAVSMAEDDSTASGQAPIALLPERQVTDVAGSVFSSALLTGTLYSLSRGICTAPMLLSQLPALGLLRSFWLSPTCHSCPPQWLTQVAGTQC